MPRHQESPAHPPWLRSFVSGRRLGVRSRSMCRGPCRCCGGPTRGGGCSDEASCCRGRSCPSVAKQGTVCKSHFVDRQLQLAFNNYPCAACEQPDTRRETLDIPKLC